MFGRSLMEVREPATMVTLCSPLPRPVAHEGKTVANRLLCRASLDGLGQIANHAVSFLGSRLFDPPRVCNPMGPAWHGDIGRHGARSWPGIVLSSGVDARSRSFGSEGGTRSAPILRMPGSDRPGQSWLIHPLSPLAAQGGKHANLSRLA